MDSELLEKIESAIQDMRVGHDTRGMSLSDFDMNAINETVKFVQNKYANIYFELQRSSNGLLLEIHK